MVIANYVHAFGAADSVDHEVIAEANHGLSQKAWRRAWGELLVRWVTTRLTVGKPRADGTRRMMAVRPL